MTTASKETDKEKEDGTEPPTARPEGILRAATTLNLNRKSAPGNGCQATTFGKNMDISEIDHLFSHHFTYLDRVVGDRLSDHDQRQRGPVVMALSELDRDLYFIHDIKAITCNAGMGAWVDYHIDDSNWIDDAARAFEAIGYGVVGRNLKECRKRYIAAGRNFENWDDRDLSKPVWDLEEQLMQALYDHLTARDFVFKKLPKE